MFYMLENSLPSELAFLFWLINKKYILHFIFIKLLSLSFIFNLDILSDIFKCFIVKYGNVK